MKKYFNFLFVLCAVCLSAMSCNNKPKEQVEDDGITEFARYLTTQDTIDVENLVKSFLDKVVDGRFEDAAAMLYAPDTANVWNEPMLLDNDQLQAETNRLAMLPPQSYTIDYVNFNTAVDNDVKVTLVITQGDADNNIEPVVVSIHLNPMNYLGCWRLCLAKKN